MVGSAGGNIYLRLSLMRAKPGEEAHVSEILDELIRFYSTRSGYVEGYTLVESDPGQEVGRLTLWRSEADAEHVASMDHVMALRAELIRVVEAGSHLEKSFRAEGRQPAEPTSG